MGAQLPAAGAARKGGGDPSPRWGASGKSDPIGRYLSPELGLAPKTVEHLTQTIGLRCAAIIHAFRQLGDDERLARFLEPIDRAREGREPPPNCEATWTAAQQADAMEDVAELRYQLDRSDANLTKLIKSTRETIRYETAKLDMLEAEQRRRGVR